MQPQFQDDLQASREEQQGVVFYRIDDPNTQTSFRLYEIEYLIAKKLNGQRDLGEVITVVKSEYNFDISDPDLRKFVSQLESMGFISGSEAPALVDTSDVAIIDETEAETGIYEPPESAPTSPLGVEASAAAMALPDEITTVGDEGLEDVGGPGDTGDAEGHEDVSERRPTASPDEVYRMMRTAVEYLAQDYMVHARDYFLAAHESTSDAGLRRVVAQLGLLGDEPSEDELKQLKATVAQAFPELASEFSLGTPGRSGGEDNLKSRLVWTAVLLVVIVGGVTGLWWFANEAGLFQSAARAKVATLSAAKQPVLFEGTATQATQSASKWLEASAGGKVASVLKAGEKANAGDVLVEFELDSGAAKKLKAARGNLKKFQSQHKKALTALKKLSRQRQQIENQRDGVNKKIKALKPDGVLQKGKATKKKLDKLKKQLVKANKKLSKLAKKERKPLAQEAKLKKKLEAVRAAIEKVQNQAGDKVLRAKVAGVAEEVRVKAGDKVKAGQKLVLVRGAQSVTLTFSGSDWAGLQTGGEAQVQVGGDTVVSGKVVSVSDEALQVVLSDPDAIYSEKKADAFRLVKQFIDLAFKVPTTALVSMGDGQGILIAVEGRIVHRKVETLGTAGEQSIVKGADDALGDGDRLIVETPEEGGIAAFEDGQVVEILP